MCVGTGKWTGLCVKLEQARCVISTSKIGGKDKK